MRAIESISAAVLVLATWLAAQTTQPAAKDDTIDWLMSKATTAPAAAQPTSKPANPFGDRARNPEARMGTIILSNKERIHAELSTTREKPIRVWDEQAKEYHDVPFALIKSLEAQILWERDEKEWHFKESGSDVKEYSGKTYPARELLYVVELINGQKITGGIVSPLYASGGETTVTYVLNKRQKGDIGKMLKELVYVRRVEFDE
jgi:hypothetical protein